MPRPRIEPQDWAERVKEFLRGRPGHKSTWREISRRVLGGHGRVSREEFDSWLLPGGPLHGVVIAAQELKTRRGGLVTRYGLADARFDTEAVRAKHKESQRRAERQAKRLRARETRSVEQKIRAAQRIRELERRNGVPESELYNPPWWDGQEESPPSREHGYEEREGDDEGNATGPRQTAEAESADVARYVANADTGTRPFAPNADTGSATQSACDTLPVFRFSSSDLYELDGRKALKADGREVVDVPNAPSLNCRLTETGKGWAWTEPPTRSGHWEFVSGRWVWHPTPESLLPPRGPVVPVIRNARLVKPPGACGHWPGEKDGSCTGWCDGPEASRRR